MGKRLQVIGDRLLPLFLAAAILPDRACCQTARTAAPASRGPVTEAMLQNLEKLPHAGTVEDALVGIRVTGTKPDGSPLTPRTGNGLVIRCDGFMVVPFDLFNLLDGTPSSPEKQTIHVTFRPGAEASQTVSMPRRSRWFIENMRRFGLAVFRTDGAVHSPALRTLLPDTLKPGDSVEVVWRNLDPATGRFGPLVRRPARLATKPEGAEGQGLADESFAHPGRVWFAEPLEGVPAGAVVIGPDGMGIGVVPGSARAAVRDSFVSFAVLAHLTNCVGAVPTPESQFRASSPEAFASAPAGGELDRLESGTAPAMVKVPGGPVIVPKAMLLEQPDMEGEPVACTPAFEIDRLEVTNSDYLGWWNGLPEKERQDPLVRQAYFPLGWAPAGVPFPDSIGSLPVLGVPLAGAQAYAKAHGKRLPTPYEWARAAFGPKGELSPPQWIHRYIAERNRAWDSLVKAHAGYLRANPGLLAPHIIADEQGKPRPDPAWVRFSWEAIPWIYSPRGNSKELVFSFEMTNALVTSLMRAWISPIYAIRGGSRAYDVSPYGASDMMLNAWELYQSNPGTPLFGRVRYAVTSWDDMRLIPPEWKPFHPTWTPNFFWIGSSWSTPWPSTEATLSRLYKRTIMPRFYTKSSSYGYWTGDHWEILSWQRDDRPQPVSMEVTVFVENVRLAASMLHPLEGWRFHTESIYELGWRMGSGRAKNEYAESPTANPNVVRFDWRLVDEIAYPWAAGALHYERELGYPPAMGGTLLVPPGPQPRDERYMGYTVNPPNVAPEHFYIMPVGFRCAR